MKVLILALLIMIGILDIHGAPVQAFTTDGQEDICATVAVVFCDNFEARALGQSDFGRPIYKSLGWGLSCCPVNTTVSVVNTQARDGTHSVQFEYQPNDGGGGIVNDYGIGGPLPDAYIRWYMKWGGPFFQWSANATKHMLFLNQNFKQTNEYNFFPGGPTSLVMAVQYSSQITNGNSILGPNVGPPFPGTNQNQWYCYETHIKGNTATDSQDGVFEGWIDGVQYWQYIGYNLDNQGGPYLINGLNASGYWNCADGPLHPCTAGFPGNDHPTMFRYMDNVVISKQRIGCLGGASGAGGALERPTVPQGLRMK
jgi:hypothetical protein